ncbi:MAG: citrate lyase acyl carrier protein [Eubacteriales bacterium]|nr:citrate lyase acyl carrier protein [Eubacteriales bacterium]
MLLKKPAMAGTLESSDAQVTISPKEGGVDVEIKSSVMYQYGRQIEECVRETLKNLNVDNAYVKVVDQGALECTLKARVECAAFRSAEVDNGYPWGGAIK